MWIHWICPNLDPSPGLAIFNSWLTQLTNYDAQMDGRRVHGFFKCPFNLNKIVWHSFLNTYDRGTGAHVGGFVCTVYFEIQILVFWVYEIGYYVGCSFDVRSKNIGFGDFRSILVFPTLARPHSIDSVTFDRLRLFLLSNSKQCQWD